MRLLVTLFCLAHALSFCRPAKENASETNQVAITVEDHWIGADEYTYYGATRSGNSDCWFEHDTRNSQTVIVNSTAVKVSSYSANVFNVLNAEYEKNSSVTVSSGVLNASGCKAEGMPQVTQALEDGDTAAKKTYKLNSANATCFKAIMWLFKHSQDPSILEAGKSCIKTVPPSFLPKSL